MPPITEFDFVPLHFDEHGALRDSTKLDALRQNAMTATDAILLAHGFCTSDDGATTLYTDFLHTFKQNLGRTEFHDLGTRKFVVAGVYWPSKSFQDSFPSDAGGSLEGVAPEVAERELVRARLEDLKGEVSSADAAKLEAAQALLNRLPDDAGAQDEFVAAVLSILQKSQVDATEGLDRILAQNGSELLDKLRLPIFLPVKAGDPGDGGIAPLEAVGGASAIGDGGLESLDSIVGSIFGAVGKLLNLTTWYIMKDRCGVVGATGVAQAVRVLKASHPDLRIHLVGHSLGGRLMASCSKSLTQSPQLQPDSVTLLEAAFSHFGFSPNNGDGVPGFFRDVIDQKAIKGPIMATFSFQDSVVGLAYAIASRLALDNTEAIGDSTDPYGGIGRNGCQKTSESAVAKLKVASAPGGPYVFKTGIVTCLDGSGGLIASHGDVTNENVTYAFAAVVAET